MLKVQAATEAFVGRLTKPAVQIKAPSIDFSKPRLVQITVSDVGACMPLVHLVRLLSLLIHNVHIHICFLANNTSC